MSDPVGGLAFLVNGPRDERPANGDFNGARALLSRLRTGSDRETNDVRLRLLDAHVTRVETALGR